ncbi:MAG TPA: serine/threonine-protein kinase, partial [Gemmataceae bacterium]|nr:serine/threonine-protein kinase [Gemmataceae bacterium]
MTQPKPRLDAQEFIDHIVASGLMDREEVQRAVESLPPTDRAKIVARHLVEAGKLTKFQAERLLGGKTDGFQLGQYRILDELGRGGMGRVYKAVHLAMGRFVALKMISPALTQTERARELFQREVRAAGRLHHPNIVTFYDAHTSGDRCYLVMEFVDGPNLSQLVREQGPLPVEQACEYIRQAAVGLEYAHAQGLIHRDIKPANILLENGVERVKITDFGLARAVDDATLSQSGVVAGTPQYMSPEQAGGEPVDHRTDLFSLGSVLYALCTGRPAFRGHSSMATLRKVCEQRPRPIQELNPEIPSWLVRIIEKLHAKDPAGRYGSAAEVADLLGRCLAHVQQPASVPLPAELRPARNRRAMALWGTLPVGLVLAALLCWPGAREAAGQAVSYVATVLRLKTPEGTLVVETEDPGVGIKLDGSELVVTGAGVKELRLSVGQHNVQTLKDGRILREEL